MLKRYRTRAVRPADPINKETVKMSSNRQDDAFAGDIPVLNELASLIGSLGLDTPNKYQYKETDESIKAELREVTNYEAFKSPTLRILRAAMQGGGRVDGAASRASSALHDMSSISLAQGADSSVFTNMRGLLQSVNPYGTEQHVINDQDEHTVVRYGTQCSFRSRAVSACFRASSALGI